MALGSLAVQVLRALAGTSAGGQPETPRRPSTTSTGSPEVGLTASRSLTAVAACSLDDVEDSPSLPQFRALVVLARVGPATDPACRATGRKSFGCDARGRTPQQCWDDRPLNPDDRRRESILSLTAIGRRVVEPVTDRRRAEIADIVERMPETHRDRSSRRCKPSTPRAVCRWPDMTPSRWAGRSSQVDCHVASLAGIATGHLDPRVFTGW